MRKITIEMACSINGLIATEDGNEDFLSFRGWEIMLEFLKEYDVLIWGRKTWEAILSWGNDYVNDLKNINIIILSETSNKQNEFSNITYCNSIENCLKVCESLKYEKLLISGGATINNAFIEKGIVDNIILNYNPFVLNKGIPLFKGNYFENKLKLEKVVKEKEDIVQDFISSDGKQVYVPQFPIGVGYQNYENWSKLLKYYLDLGLINENTTIIGHSIAPVFVCKFLVENKFKVKKLIFVCGFNNYLGINDEYDTVNKTMYFNNLEDVKQYTNEIICFYSDNDPYVKYEVEKEFAEKIATQQILIPNAGHINSESGYDMFEDIVSYI